MEQEIINNINELYENLNVNKAVFIVDDNYYDETYKQLIKLQYPVSLFKDIKKFKKHDTRILLIKITELCNFEELDSKLNNISLILFINIPKIDNLIFINNYFKYDNIDDIKIIEI